MSQYVRGLIREAMQHVGAWKRKEVADTIITLRKAGKLSIREIALAVDRSPRHVKRVLHDAGLSQGKAASQPAQSRPAVAPPPATPPAPVRHEAERYEEEIARRDRERLAAEWAAEKARTAESRERLDAARATMQGIPVGELVAARESDPLDAALARAMHEIPRAGVVVVAAETEPPQTGEIRRYGIEAESLVRRAGRRERAGPDGRPVLRAGWSFPNLSNLRLR